MERLFDIAVEKVLSYPELIKNGVPVLPKKIAQYLLHLCCQSARHEEITHIIQHWPHQELSFNFLSNSLCVSSSSEECLSAHEYYSTRQIDCTATSEDLDNCIPSITKGLFLHFSQTVQPCLTVVDLSSIMAWTMESGKISYYSNSGQGNILSGWYKLTLVLNVFYQQSVVLEMSQGYNFVFSS